MKKRNLMIFSVVVLVIALVAGGTAAWFTAEDDATNTFKAGTVEIVLHDLTLVEDDGETFEQSFIEFEPNFQNVNPGDEYSKIVRVENVGSKRAYVRVMLEPKWDLVGEEDIFPQDGGANVMWPADLVELDETNWKLIEGWYYYTRILEADDETENLFTGVSFEGEGMGNEYQGATFELSVKAEAVQASYDQAAIDEWGINPSEFLAPAAE